MRRHVPNGEMGNRGVSAGYRRRDLDTDKFWTQKEVQVVLGLGKVISITVVNADDWKLARLAWSEDLGWVY